MAYELVVFSAFLQGKCTTHFLQGHASMEQEYPWILQQLSSAICSHGGVHDRFWVSMDYKNLPICKFKLDVSSMT